MFDWKDTHFQQRLRCCTRCSLGQPGIAGTRPGWRACPRPAAANFPRHRTEPGTSRPCSGRGTARLAFSAGTRSDRPTRTVRNQPRPLRTGARVRRRLRKLAYSLGPRWRRWCTACSVCRPSVASPWQLPEKVWYFWRTFYELLKTLFILLVSL